MVSVRPADCVRSVVAWGRGWLDYDRLFRQQAALNPSFLWSSLHPTIMAFTIRAQRSTSGGGTVCLLCQGFDHSQAVQCALAYLRQPTHQDPVVPYLRLPAQRQPQPVCLSWNEGQCCYHPNPCFHLHHCATCGSPQHKARDYRDTPPYSRFRNPRRTPGPPTSSSSSAL